MPPAYAELHCVSNFSFLRGASTAGELFERARKLGYRALAITDECSLAGIVRALEASERTGLPLIVGSEIRFDDGLALVLLCETRAGYTRLCELITRGRRAADKGRYRLARSDLADVGTDGLLCLWLPQPGCFATAGAATTIDPQAQLAWLRPLFDDRLWIAAGLHRDGDDAERLALLQSLGAMHDIPLVAAGDVHMHQRRRRALQDALTAIRLRTTVAEAGHALFPNGERHLRTRDALASLYPPALLAESVRIAERCRFSLRELKYEYPKELVPAGETLTTQLRKLVEAGARRRWPSGIEPAHRALIEKELRLIEELTYEAFFLTVHDIVAWARSKDILCQGRGSAVNSIVCYCLHITAIGPERIHMLFERFLSRERKEPPDIDVDFEHERREEVIQYVYAKYGRRRAALAATVIGYRSKSAARDLGRALGFSADQLEQLSQVFSYGHHGIERDLLLRERGFDPGSDEMRRFLVLFDELRGFPRHLSQHVGGFVVSDQPLSQLVPVENAAMPDRTIIQWDKDDLEELGLLKVDCLALGMLTCLRRCFDLIKASRGVEYTLATVPEGDAATYAMIQRADTVGVFQIESRAQMSMLPRLKPANFYDLVIEVAIVRPGPIQGDMVHPYLRRRCGDEQWSLPKPELEPVLKRTFGVPIFQEQVMHLMMVAAEFSPEEADKLRRSMAAWKRRGGLEHWHDKIVERMTARGYERDYAERIFQMITGFGEYGFPESHAASFALLAYVSSWLKCHEPAAFAAALINSQPMGFYSPSQIVQDLRRPRAQIRDSGFGIRQKRDAVLPGGGAHPESAQVSDSTEHAAKPCSKRIPNPESRVPALSAPDVRPADVQRSDWDCTLEPAAGGGSALRLGLRLVRGLPEACARRIMAARAERPFRDVEDLIARAALDGRERRLLAAADALHALAGHRHRAFWDVAGSMHRDDLLAPARIADERVRLTAPDAAATMRADYASTGLTLKTHPMQLLRGRLQQQRCRRSDELEQIRDGAPVRVAGLVTLRQRPGTAGGVIFVTLEDERGTINLIVWRSVAERQRRALLESQLMAVDGVLQKQHGVVHLVAGRLRNLNHLLDGLNVESRNFH